MPVIFPELISLSNQKAVVKLEYTLESCFVLRNFKDEKSTTPFSGHFQCLVAITINLFGPFFFFLVRICLAWTSRHIITCIPLSARLKSPLQPSFCPHIHTYMIKSPLNLGFKMIYLHWVPSLSSTYTVNNASQSFSHATCSPLKSFQHSLGLQQGVLRQLCKIKTTLNLEQWFVLSSY